MPAAAFGIFDHVDRSDEPVGALYEHRLRLVEAAEAAGFRTYHVAEHHATRLGMAPSPGIFLTAVAQRTRRIRFGPLVYRLPLFMYGNLSYEQASRSLELWSREVMPKFLETRT